MNREHEHNGGGRGINARRFKSAEPLASVIGGSALAIYGVTRKSLGGAALAAVGGLLVYHGASERRHPSKVHIQRSVTIMKPVDQLYRFWRNFENLPRFMSHLESVKSSGDRWSEWTARAPLGANVSWHAEVTDDRENDYIVWRSLPGSDIENVGSIRFREAPGDRGTEITVSLQYNPPAGKIGHALAYMFGENPEQQIREDLRHFKQLMEAGEIPTTEGQPHGPRSLIGRTASKWGTDEQVRRRERQAAQSDQDTAIRQVPA